MLLHRNVLLYFYISISICTFDSIAIIDLPRPFPHLHPPKTRLCAAIEALHCKQDLHKFSIFNSTFSRETEVKSNPVDLLNGKKDLNTVQTIFSIIFAKVILSFSHTNWWFSSVLWVHQIESNKVNPRFFWNYGDIVLYFHILLTSYFFNFVITFMVTFGYY